MSNNSKKNGKKKQTKKSTSGKPNSGNAISKTSTVSNNTTTSASNEQKDKVTELTQSNRQLKRKIFDLYTVFEISRNFNSVLNYQNLLDSFILTSLAQVSASKGAIFIKEVSRTDKFTMAKGKGSGQFPSPDQFFDGNGKLANYISHLNRPVVTEDLFDDTASEAEQKILAMFHPGVVVPMIYKTRLSGFLLVSDKISQNEFSLDDIEFLSILVNQIVVAIENARLYEAEKQASELLRAAQHQLVNTERLAALGEMSARVAHEINNPLGIIKNYMLLVRRTMGKNIEASGYADIVGQEIDRIANIVRELLDFYRPVKDDLEPLDVVAVMDDVLTLMDRQFKKLNIELITDFNTDEFQINGLADSLKQVFLNIIINACDAMSSGGKLGVKVKLDNNEMIISFYDTGPGIQPEIIPRIFEPFYTTKQSGKGTGLGLSVCYGIIKRHNGSITYKNKDDGGCFEIKLPIHKDTKKNE